MRFPRVLFAVLVMILLFGGAYLFLGLSPVGLFLPPREGTGDGPTAYIPAHGPDSPSESAAHEEKRTPAPDFTMTDADGNTVKLSDFRGKPVLLNFWASWCDPCRSEMPHFEAAYAEHSDALAFVMLNLLADPRETPEKAAAFIAEGGYTFPCYGDTANEAAAAYGVTSIPRTMMIDAEGNLLATYPGTLDAEQLDACLALLLPPAL